MMRSRAREKTPPRSGAALLKLVASGVVVGAGLVAVGGCLLAPFSRMRGATRAAERTHCRNNLKAIGSAIDLYVDEFGELPTNIVDDDGRPLLSWRVRLLPYRDRPAYEAFDLTQPWDAPVNREAAASRRFELWSCPSQDSPAGETPYLAVMHEGRWLSDVLAETRAATRDESVGEGDRDIQPQDDGRVPRWEPRPVSLDEVPQVVEVAEESTVFWTRPVDLEIAESSSSTAADEIAASVVRHRDGRQVRLEDGSVRTWFDEGDLSFAKRLRQFREELESTAADDRTTGETTASRRSPDDSASRSGGDES